MGPDKEKHSLQCKTMVRDCLLGHSAGRTLLAALTLMPLILKSEQVAMHFPLIPKQTLSFDIHAPNTLDSLSFSTPVQVRQVPNNPN